MSSSVERSTHRKICCHVDPRIVLTNGSLRSRLSGFTFRSDTPQHHVPSLAFAQWLRRTSFLQEHHSHHASWRPTTKQFVCTTCQRNEAQVSVQ
ncbi:Protein of unknown function [Pyronema omphalodes CBS 100304]|uniref:Uncharacterized protein n=1 Tax=Pyronema omphalodes (strain CBS 100304) TaxID=1076935 RepID=U4L6H7_PYROM|nr:Protein of unknown function [Pyronema omphalodes CBS 100304]